MECDLVYEVLEGFSPFQSINVDGHFDHFSNILSRVLI
jgi:hypothetical protein